MHKMVASPSLANYSTLSKYALLAHTGITTTPAVTVSNGNVGSDTVPALSTDFIFLNGSQLDNTNSGTGQTQLINFITDLTNYTSSLTTSSIPAGSPITINPNTNYNDTAITFSSNTKINFDANNDPNAQFFIISDSSITFTGPIAMFLINGAQSQNIFWLAKNGAITFSDPSPVSVYGTFIAQTSVTLTTTTPSVIDGHLFAQTGDITFSGIFSIDSLTSGTSGLTCFNKGTKILTKEGYQNVEDLRPGTLIKTLCHGYRAIYMIGKKDIYHKSDQMRIKDQLYLCSPTNYHNLTGDLLITGCHSILIDEFMSDEEKEETVKVNGDLFITDGKYRLPACVDKRTAVFETPGNYTIYHFSLENEDYYMNYGVYANGLLVETCSKRYLKELSKMELIH